MIDIQNNVMLHEARKARHKPHIVLQILIFIAVLLVSQIASGMVIGVPLGIAVMAELGLEKLAMAGPAGATAAVYDFMGSLPEWFSVASLLGTAITTLLVIVYCRGIEGRSTASMGLARNGMLKRYGLGFLIGTVMITATVALAVLLGGARFTGFNAGVSLLYLGLFFLGYLVQGMSEEVCVRGYFMVSCMNRVGAVAAVLISSLAFAAMHLLNAGVTVLAFANLTLFGVFTAVYVLRTDDLWGVCAIHSAWNFLQGNIFGISVSGTGATSSLFGTAFTEGRELISGGAFGIEGGLCTTVVLLAGTALALFLPLKPRPALPQEETETEPAAPRAPLPVYIQK